MKTVAVVISLFFTLPVCAGSREETINSLKEAYEKEKERLDLEIEKQLAAIEKNKANQVAKTALAKVKSDLMLLEKSPISRLTVRVDDIRNIWSERVGEVGNVFVLISKLKVVESNEEGIIGTSIEKFGQDDLIITVTVKNQGLKEKPKKGAILTLDGYYSIEMRSEGAKKTATISKVFWTIEELQTIRGVK